MLRAAWLLRRFLAKKFVPSWSLLGGPGGGWRACKSALSIKSEKRCCESVAGGR